MQDKNVKLLPDTPDEVVKIGSLLKVFSTVIKSLGDEFNPHESRLLSMSYFLEVSWLKNSWCFEVTNFFSTVLACALKLETHR